MEWCVPALGNENREALFRAASPPGTPYGQVSNFEIEAFDGSANPHLGLAAIIAAGIDGLRRHFSLPEPVDTNPNPENFQRLPKSLSESLEALHKDDFLKEIIGEKLMVAIKAIRKVEVVQLVVGTVARKLLLYQYQDKSARVNSRNFDLSYKSGVIMTGIDK